MTETDHLGAIEAVAVQVARQAGERALAAFQATRTLQFKGNKADDPVTATDRDLEAFLRAELRRHFPDHGILGEEDADDIAPGARFVWVLDPLDGTANFASGLPLWGVSLGLLFDGAPVVGCIWVPVGPDLTPGVYHARAAGGAGFDDAPVAVSQAGDERGQIMALPGFFLRTFRLRRAPTGQPRPRRALPDARSLGSCTAELVLVAAGALRATVFVRPHIWDVAAGALIVQEAGGRALTWHGGGWQPLAHYAAATPDRGPDPPALRHWAQPVLAGAPETVDHLLARLAWHPRLPGPLRRALGFA